VLKAGNPRDKEYLDPPGPALKPPLVTCKGNNPKGSRSNLSSTCLLFFFIYITKRSLFICLRSLRSPPFSSYYATFHCSLLKRNFSSQLSLASQRDSFRRIAIQQYELQLQSNRNSNTAIHYQLAGADLILAGCRALPSFAEGGVTSHLKCLRCFLLEFRVEIKELS